MCVSPETKCFEGSDLHTQGDLSSDKEDRFYPRLARSSAGDFYLFYLITAKNTYLTPPSRCSSGVLQDFSGLLILFRPINPETSDQQIPPPLPIRPPCSYNSCTYCLVQNEKSGKLWGATTGDDASLLAVLRRRLMRASSRILSLITSCQASLR